MNSVNELKDDLSFVAHAVKQAEPAGIPAILLLWAVLIPIGFALADFVPRWVGWYWAAAAPLGVMASAFLGHHAAKSWGVLDQSLARRHGWHWLTLLAAYALVGAGMVTGRMDPVEVAPIFLLITALAYTTAGVHLEDSRGMLPAGAIMFAGYAAVMWLPLPNPWTVTGLLASAALVVAALRGARTRASA